jgi:hypothetical protein
MGVLMAKKSYTYQIRTSPAVPVSLAALAADLGFTVKKSGVNFGRASVPQMFAALAAAYDANPRQVTEALKSIVSSPG